MLKQTKVVFVFLVAVSSNFWNFLRNREQLQKERKEGWKKADSPSPACLRFPRPAAATARMPLRLVIAVAAAAGGIEAHCASHLICVLIQSFPNAINADYDYAFLGSNLGAESAR